MTNESRLKVVLRHDFRKKVLRLRKALYFLRQIGFDPVKTFRALSSAPLFIKSLVHFISLNGSIRGLRVSPVLNDFKDSAGSADGHYFWQDLICAKWIFAQNPVTHLDVGSRIDGFIGHLITFREVTLLDIRPMKNTVPNLKYIFGNAQDGLTEFRYQFDSVSSLHSIEHFGLGRYGDPLDIEGHTKGLSSIAECVQPGGSLYVSFPIGKSTVEFNEQRIIDANWPSKVLSDFSLKDFVLIPWKGEPVFGLNPQEINPRLIGQAGLYWFIRNSE